jgi:mono/diheme cytochrome c family protein
MSIFSLYRSFWRASVESASRSSRSGVCGIAACLLVAVSTMSTQTGKSQTIGSTQTDGKSVGNADHGKLVFQSQGCDKCHGSVGEGLSASGSNPGVTPITSTTLGLTSFIQLVRKPVGNMPPFGKKQVSDMDLTDVYAFLHTSSAPVENNVSAPANVKNGQQLFAKYGCSECHLSKGQGARATGVRLGPPQIPLSAFVSYVHQPTGEMPPYTQKTVTNEELADMYAYLNSMPAAPSWKNIPLLNNQ